MFGKSFLYCASSAIAFCGFIAPASASSLSFDRKFIAPDGAMGEYLGFSVAIDGNYALLGAWGDDDNGPSSGSAYLFDTTTGNFLQKLTAPDGASSDHFGLSVAIDENYALVGARHNDGNDNNSGSAYLFDTTTGSLLQKLTAPDGANGDSFGESVAIDGNYALVGAWGDDDNEWNSGSAYLFDTTTGSLLQKLTAPDAASNDRLSLSVAIDGNYALLGAWADDDNGSNSGSAYLFDTTTGNFLQKLTAPDGASGDSFGRSVAIDGNYALVGADGDDDDGRSSGSAYLFDTTTGSLLQKLIAPDAASGDQFGESVAIDGNYALVGAFLDDDNGSRSGSAYLFDTTTGSLLQKLTAPNGTTWDYFGGSVAIDGNSVLVGAFGDDDRGESSGAAYLFSLNPQTNPEPNPIPEPASILGLLVLGGLGATSFVKRGE